MVNNQFNENIMDDLDTPVKNKNHSLFVAFFLNTFFSLLIGFGIFLGLFKLYPDLFGDTVTNITKTEKEVTVTDTGIADAVEKVYDSVVIIKTYVNDKLYATGTGFIYSSVNNKYYFITNHHVIEKGQKIEVQFSDGNSAVVKLENSDKYVDIAVLSLETNKEYKAIEMGSNVDSRVGDTVFAIGSPLNYEVYSWSVTRGIISGKDREVAVTIDSSNSYDYVMQVIQTDAAINNGNSGGPLCNVNGEVIGVTNMKLASSTIEGMGFAIPIEEASRYADAVINGEDVSRPFLGVNLSDANSESTASKYGFEAREGVLIEYVESGTGADEAGLKAGDIIVALDDVKIKDVATLRYQLYKYKVGDTITVEYVRNGSSKTTQLKLGVKKS